MSNILYESEYQSIFWILYDGNKRALCHGDAFPYHYKVSKTFKFNFINFFFNFKYSKLIDKGDYCIKMHIRHEKVEMLERLKALVLYARQNIHNIQQDIYTSYSSLLKGSKKTNFNEKILRGQTFTIFLDSIHDEKLPKSVSSGNFLKGELGFYDSHVNKIV